MHLHINIIDVKNGLDNRSLDICWRLIWLTLLSVSYLLLVLLLTVPCDIFDLLWREHGDTIVVVWLTKEVMAWERLDTLLQSDRYRWWRLDWWRLQVVGVVWLVSLDLETLLLLGRSASTSLLLLMTMINRCLTRYVGRLQVYLVAKHIDKSCLLLFVSHNFHKLEGAILGIWLRLRRKELLL